MSSRTNCVACDEIPGTITIFGSAMVSKMFKEITGLNVEDTYSICKACQQELRSCYNFRMRCHEIYNLYDSTTTAPSTSTAPPSSNPIRTLSSTPEITIVKNEPKSSTVTFHNEDESPITYDDFHNDDEEMDDAPQEDEFESAFQYEDINPQMSDDDDDDESNEDNYDETGAPARFECDECQKMFSKRSRLIAHKAEHRNERLYACPRVGCNSAFNVPHRLTRHLKNVHDADDEEINESTYALVEDNEGVYVIRNSWLFYKEGVPYICYPPPTVQNPENFAKFITKPVSDWVEYQVKIIRQKIPTFELTKRLQEIRLAKRNLKSADLDSAPAKRPKLADSNLMPLFSLKQSGPLKPNRFIPQPHMNMPAYQHEKIKLMEFSFNTQMRDLKKKLNYLLQMVQHGRGSGNSVIKNTLEDDQYSPKAISNEPEFLEMEQNLIEHDRNPLISSEFSIKRERMIDHYAAKLKNISKRTNPKIGLIGSLLNLYFAPEFLNSIGWTNAQGRLAVKDMVGHISLFFEIVNRNTPGTYVNMEEASTALYTFLRRFHESKNAKHRVKDKDMDVYSKMTGQSGGFRQQMEYSFPKMEPTLDITDPTPQVQSPQNQMVQSQAQGPNEN